jgi:hypothetical protein
MVNVRTQVGGNPKTLRGQRTQENLDKLRALQPGGVRVVPGVHPSMTAEQIRKNIKHARGIAFRPTGSVEWPNDRFTKKMLRAGVVKLADDVKESRETRNQQPERPAADTDE